MRGLGTLLNLVTVAAGALAGILFGDRLPERIHATLVQGVGLVVLAVGVVGLQPLQDADEGLKRFIIMIAAVIVGGVIGEATKLEERLEATGQRLRRRFARGAHEGSNEESSRFVEGFIVSSTVFCVGPLTILGAVEDGLGTSVRLLAIKSALDGVVAVGFASAYGAGVLASLVTIAVYQGLLTLGAALIEPLMTEAVLAELGATGSLLVIGIALRLLGVVQIRVVSLLPALPLAMAAAGAVDSLP